ncbi:MAG: outer membrane protein assembly factor BamD [Bdellovibrionales bacterium]|nr:outer membrane protein assembly factor BamD [Bdellovibrionales bacterium]
MTCTSMVRSQNTHLPSFAALFRVTASFRVTARILLLAPLALSPFVLTSCSSSSSEEVGPKEIPLSEEAKLEGSEQELFASAQRLYENGYYLVARDAFQSIVDGYPMGPYAEFSEIKLADTFFLATDYDEAAPLYEKFIKNYPSSGSSEYVLLKAGRSYQLVNTGLGRDREPLEKALALYNEFLDRFPDSLYRDQVYQYKREVQEELAQHEKMIADFYHRRGKEIASERRTSSYKLAQAALESEESNMARLIPPRLSAEVSPGTTDSPQAPVVVRASWDRSTWSDVGGQSLGVADQSATHQSLPGTSHPNAISRPTVSRIGRVATVAASDGSDRDVSKSLPVPSVLTGNPPAPGSFAPESPVLGGLGPFRAIECGTSDSKRKIVLELTAPLKRYESPIMIDSDGGLIDVPILPAGASSGGLSFDCYEPGGLIFTREGTLQIPMDSSVRVFELERPSRLVILEQ